VFTTGRLQEFYQSVKTEIMNNIARFFVDCKKVIESIGSAKADKASKKFSIFNGDIETAKKSALSYALEVAKKVITTIAASSSATIGTVEANLLRIIEKGDNGFLILFDTILVPLLMSAFERHGIEVQRAPPFPPGNVLEGVLENIRKFTNINYEALEQSVASVVKQGVDTVQKLENSKTTVDVEVKEAKIDEGTAFHIKIGSFEIGRPPSVKFDTKTEKREVPTVIAKDVKMDCFFVSPHTCEQIALEMVRVSLNSAFEQSSRSIPYILDKQVGEVWANIVSAPVTTLINSSKEVLQLKEQNETSESATKNEAQDCADFFESVLAELKEL